MKLLTKIFFFALFFFISTEVAYSQRGEVRERAEREKAETKEKKTDNGAKDKKTDDAKESIDLSPEERHPPRSDSDSTTEEIDLNLGKDRLERLDTNKRQRNSNPQ